MKTKLLHYILSNPNARYFKTVSYIDNSRVSGGALPYYEFMIELTEDAPLLCNLFSDIEDNCPFPEDAKSFWGLQIVTREAYEDTYDWTYYKESSLITSKNPFAL